MTSPTGLHQGTTVDQPTMRLRKYKKSDNREKKIKKKKKKKIKNRRALFPFPAAWMPILKSAYLPVYFSRWLWRQTLVDCYPRTLGVICLLRRRDSTVALKLWGTTQNLLRRDLVPQNWNTPSKIQVSCVENLHPKTGTGELVRSSARHILFFLLHLSFCFPSYKIGVTRTARRHSNSISSNNSSGSNSSAIR